MKKELKIEGMTCKHCVKHVKEALEELNGVKHVKVSLENKNATLETDKVNDDMLKNAVSEAGYEVVDIINL